MASDDPKEPAHSENRVSHLRVGSHRFLYAAALILFIAATIIMVFAGLRLQECRNTLSELVRERRAITKLNESAVNLLFEPYSSESVFHFRHALTGLEEAVEGVVLPEPLSAVHGSTVSRMERLWPAIEALSGDSLRFQGAVMIREFYGERLSDPDGTLGIATEGLLAFIIEGYSDYSNAMFRVRYIIDTRQKASFRLINIGIVLYSGALLVLAVNWGLLLTLRARRKSQELETIAEDSRKRLTEAQELLMEREKSAIIGQMVAGVAHDVTTPLGVCVTGVSYLTGVVEEAAGGTVDADDLVETLSVVQSNLDRAAQLICGFKRVTADGVGQIHREFDLVSYLADDLIPSLRPMLRKRGHSVEFEGPDSPVMMDAPGEIAEIVTNLVLNASDHAYDEGKSGTVWVSVSPRGDKADLAVSDSGRGMDEETLLRIYDPFFTTGRELGGTGLGLAVVYNIVKLKLHGDIRCTSAPGEGTTFTVSLPVVFPTGRIPASDEGGLPQT